jgi:hypothetical protein|tara:strand:+ start:126 stop:827 length:702 start_codon:yes stop_codon:yes gene_type:complete
MGNNLPQLSFLEKADICEKTGLPPTVVQGLHKRFYYMSKGKKGKDLMKHKDDLFGDDYMIHLMFTHGGFGDHLDKVTFKDFVTVFNKFSKHVSGHNKTLKDRIGWLWDFMVHSSDPTKDFKHNKTLNAEQLLTLLQSIVPEQNYELKDAQNVIADIVDETAEYIDKGSFIRYIGESIPNCNEYMEIDYTVAYGMTAEEIKQEDDLFAEDVMADLANLGDDTPRKADTFATLDE